MNDTIISFKLPRQLNNEIEDVAKQLGESKSYTIRKALVKFLRGIYGTD